MSDETQGLGGSPWEDDPRLVAYALGESQELSAADVQEIEAALESDPACGRVLGEIRQLMPGIEGALRASAASEEFELGEPARDVIRDAARSSSGGVATRGGRILGIETTRWTPLLAAGIAATLGVGAWVLTQGKDAAPAAGTEAVATASDDRAGAEVRFRGVVENSGSMEVDELPTSAAPSAAPSAGPSQSTKGARRRGRDAAKDRGDVFLGKRKKSKPAPDEAQLSMRPSLSSELSDTRSQDLGSPAGKEVQRLEAERDRLGAQLEQAGAQSPKDSPKLESADLEEVEELLVLRAAPEEQMAEQGIADAPFIQTATDPFSTFSSDVDTASYAMARAQLGRGRMPAPASVRVEEFVNYFTYGDPAPAADDPHPLAISVEVAAAPWAPEHRLVRIGLRARDMAFDDRRGANLVFLVDISGSMKNEDKLGLVKDALGVLTESLLPGDRIAIVTYASNPGVALDSTPVEAREAILQSLEALEAGGSTNGGAGIERAYAIARDHFVEGGVNRVVLCTDGDFNVGAVSGEALEELIAGEARDGIELSILGFGADSGGGDDRMERLSNRGNGNYAMIDSRGEARRVLSSEVGGTLLTVARDTKIQVAWNPARVEAFRLIGYENRMLEHRDFEDDSVDAGEVGSGHTVTALYEVIPVPGVVAGVTRGESEDPSVEGGVGVGGGAGGEGAPRGRVLPDAFTGDGLVEVRVRYKLPLTETGSEASARASTGLAGRDGDSLKIVRVGEDLGNGFAEASMDLRFAASVAAFALKLRGSASVSDVSFREIRAWALEALGRDPGGLREGFVSLVQRAMEIQGK